MSYQNYIGNERASFSNSKFGYPVYGQSIGSGDNAIRETLNRMKKVINHSVKDTTVRNFAIRLTYGYSDDLDKISIVFNWIKNNVRYIKDPKLAEYMLKKIHLYGNGYFKNPAEIEVLSSPRFLIDEYNRGKIPMEDCDGQTMLSLSLLKSLGVPVKMKVISTRPSLEFHHVYGLVLDRNSGEWLSIDTIKPHHEVGYEPEGITRFVIMEV